MYLKIHRSGDNTIVALCDRELLGRTLKEGNISVTVSEDFYKGDIVSEEKAIEVISKATNINIFGEKAVSCAVKCGAVDKSNVMIINEVAHAQIFRI
ncbi:DUF424 domain-containing protein [Methanolobus profundi]|uniref:DUF424 domain-containing protein n=1 Tax=Methanolobus profundi TaxID=487685 RepID=A0A1I4SAB2_9EURY|nr:DUF424 family protein [Methanolobus profundi]SFM61457.1 hypothetical protein SAMN04488696_1866 [Methanolobus profundi]